MQSKTCRVCKCVKPNDQFTADCSRKDGRKPDCRACRRAAKLRRRPYVPPELRAQVKSERNTQWILNNPERVRQAKQRYRERHRDELKASRAAYYLKNKDRIAIYTREYHRANPEIHKRGSDNWRAKNPHKAKANSALWRSRQLNATPGWANPFFIAEAYHLAEIRRQLCGGIWHVDHIVPLQCKTVCGLHVENNLRVIPGVENLRKGNRHWPDMP